MAETIRKSTFEKDFIERTYSSVVSDLLAIYHQFWVSVEPKLLDSEKSLKS